MLTLTRIAAPKQTLGVLCDESTAWACCTLELPWRSNARRESCIPPAPGQDAVEYEARRHDSPTFGDTLWLPEVEGRSEILVHAGNYVSDTLGCILVGRQFTDLNGDGRTDVTNSRATLEELLYHAGDETRIHVQWAEAPTPAQLADAAGVSPTALTESARV